MLHNNNIARARARVHARILVDTGLRPPQAGPPNVVVHSCNLSLELRGDTPPPRRSPAVSVLQSAGYSLELRPTNAPSATKRVQSQSKVASQLRRLEGRRAMRLSIKKATTEVAAFLSIENRQNEAYLIIEFYHFFVFLSSFGENGAVAPSLRQRCCRRLLRCPLDPSQSRSADCLFDGDPDRSPS